MEQVLTIGQIAERLSIRVHQAQYLVMSRNIKPSGLAGRYKIYDAKVVEQLEKEIKK